MPHRVNTKGDIGTAKKASDSYDADNIYLSEEGWVYRHFKNSERTRWWDEIIVSGQVKDGVDIHGVANAPVSQTNPLKLGTDDAVGYEEGDCEFDISYANMGGTPALAHLDDMETVVIDSADKTYDENGSYRVFEAVQSVPDGWTGVSDPSNEENYPLEPPYAGEDSFVAQPNEYTTEVSPLPVPGVDLEPAQVIKGEFESGAGGGYGAAQEACAGGGGGTTTIPQTAVTIGPANPVAPVTLVAEGGGASTTTTDGETTPPAPPVTYNWTWTGGSATGKELAVSSAGDYTVTASIPDGAGTPAVTASVAAPPALSVEAPNISPWVQSTSLTDQTFTATVGENGNTLSVFAVTANGSAGTIYTASNTPTATVDYTGTTLTVVVNNPDADIYNIAANPFDITGVAQSTEDGNTDELAFDVAPVVVTSNAVPSIAPTEVTDPVGGNASTITIYNLVISSSVTAILDSTVTVKEKADPSPTVFTRTPAESYQWTGSAGTWVPLTYELAVPYKKYESGSVTLTTLVISADATVGTSSTVTDETPVAVEGYYPLYTTSAASDAHAGGNGTSHSHILSGNTYFMPNGLTLGTDMFHGDYDSTGGSSSGGGSSYGY